MNRPDDAFRFMQEGLAYVQSESFALAEDSYALALENAQSTLGSGHPMTASLIGHLARAVLAQKSGREEFGMALFERQVFMYENETTLRDSLSERLTAVQELAGTYELVGRTDDAEAMSKKASELMEEVEAKMTRFEAEAAAARQGPKGDGEGKQSGADEEDEEDEEDD